MDDLLDKYSVEYYVTLSTQAQAAAKPAILSDKLLDNIVLEMERAAKNGKFGTMFDVAMPYTVTAAQLVKALHAHFRGFHITVSRNLRADSLTVGISWFLT